MEEINNQGYEVMGPAEMLAKAYSIVAKAFRFKFDRQGEPYIKHCIFVSQSVSVYGVREEIVGLLHDLLEDCKEWSAERLLQSGFSDEIVNAVNLLTFEPKLSTERYIKKVEALSSNKLARRVKIADLTHNLSVDRLKGLRESDMIRMKKYLTCIQFLKTVEANHNNK